MSLELGKSKLAYSLKKEVGTCPAKTGVEGGVERAPGGSLTSIEVWVQRMSWPLTPH